MRSPLIFAVLAIIFCFSMFYRVTNAIIAPDLTRDLGLDAETSGILGGAFFYAFALMQIPIGILLDKVGPRWVIALFSLVGASGAFVFGISTGFIPALAGRILLGMGMAAALMGAFKVFVLSFRPERFSTLAGLLVAVGTLGNLAATSPLAYLSATIGWRATFISASVITAFLSGLAFWILKDLPSPAPRLPSTPEVDSHGLTPVALERYRQITRHSPPGLHPGPLPARVTAFSKARRSFIPRGTSSELLRAEGVTPTAKPVEGAIPLRGQARAPLIDRPEGPVPLSTIWHVFGSLSFWQISSIAFFRYGTFVALQGLWLGPFFMDIKRFTPIEAGNLIMLISLGMVAGAPVAGHLNDRFFSSSKQAILTGLIAYLLCLAAFAGRWEINDPLVYCVILFFMGFTASFGTLAYTHIKELFPLKMSATATSAVNLFVMAGGAVFMQLLGYIIEVARKAGSPYPSQAYDLSFFICFAGMGISLIFYAFAKGKVRGS